MKNLNSSYKYIAMIAFLSWLSPTLSSADETSDASSAELVHYEGAVVPHVEMVSPPGPNNPGAYIHSLNLVLKDGTQLPVALDSSGDTIWRDPYVGFSFGGSGEPGMMVSRSAPLIYKALSDRTVSGEGRLLANGSLYFETYKVAEEEEMEGKKGILAGLTFYYDVIPGLYWGSQFQADDGRNIYLRKGKIGSLREIRGHCTISGNFRKNSILSPVKLEFFYVDSAKCE